jgi:hypothetical protein
MITGSLLTGAGSLYSAVVEANHSIKWWAIIMCGLIIRGMYITIGSPYVASLSPKLQDAVALFVKFTIYFCIMLIIIQFQPFYMPVVEWIVDNMAVFIEWIGGLND